MTKLPEARSEEPRASKIIEDLQTELKAYMAEAVRDGVPKETIFRVCAKKARKAREAIQSDELKARLDESTPRYIKTLYEHFSLMYAAAREMVRIYAESKSDEREPVKIEKKTGLLRDGVEIPDVEIYNMEPAARDYFAAYHRQVKDTIKSILADELRPPYDGNVNLRTIAEMTIRYDGQLQMMADLREQGEDLVWIDSHANTSVRCQPFQGRLYSLSGKSGKIDGITYGPLSEATDIPYVTRRGRVYMNGCITGFGCRHKLIPYRKGSKPQVISAETIRKKRAAEEMQRSFERKIRYQKEKAIAIAYLQPKEAAKARAKAKQLTARYDAFSKRNGMPIIRERTRVVFGENIYERNKDRIEPKKKA